MRHLLALVLLALLATPAALSQISFLPYVGYQTNLGFDLSAATASEAPTGGVIVGVGAELALTPGILPIGIAIRPSVETSFLSGDTGDITTIYEYSQSTLRVNGDLIGSFSPPLSPVGLYAGVGVAYTMYSLEESLSGGGSSVSETTEGTGFGLNALAGARFGGGFIQPYVEGRFSTADPTPEEFDDEAQLGSSITVMVGARIGL